MSKKHDALPDTRDDRPKYFWLFGAVLAIALAALLCRGITRQFDGLHSWAQADSSWFARCHVKYGLGYTRGVMTQAVGDPPPENPMRYLDHPQLTVLINSAVMLVFGINEWALKLAKVILAVPTMLLLLWILRRLVGDRTALLAGLCLMAFPMTGQFGVGDWMILAALLSLRWYLILIGEMTDGPVPKPRHLIALGVSLFIMLQLSWTGFFYAAGIGVHYVCRCIRRRSRPKWSLLAVVTAAPIASAVLVFGIMASGMDWDFGRIWEIYKWRSGKAEMTNLPEFLWSAWFSRFWEFALLNFTLPLLILSILGIVIVVWTYLSRAFNRSPEKAPEPIVPRQTLIFLLPAVFQLYFLKGALWKHQYWERPLGPFVAITGAVAVVALWNRLKKVHIGAAAVGMVVLAAVVGYYAVEGHNYYRGIRWQHPEKIRMWKKLNALIPSDKPLLTFDAELDNLIVTQHAAKGAVIRGEPAWYIDRRIVEAPSADTRKATYRRLSRAYVDAMRSSRAGTIPAFRIRAIFNSRIRNILSMDLPAILREIDERAQTRQYPVYLVPYAFGRPDIDSLIVPLNAELQKRYRTIEVFREQRGTRDEQGRFFKAGMRRYYLYDLRAPLTRGE